MTWVVYVTLWLTDSTMANTYIVLESHISNYWTTQSVDLLLFEIYFPVLHCNWNAEGDQEDFLDIFSYSSQHSQSLVVAHRKDPLKCHSSATAFELPLFPDQTC